jgi:hypothetical protein
MCYIDGQKNKYSALIFIIGNNIYKISFKIIPALIYLLNG